MSKGFLEEIKKHLATNVVIRLAVYDRVYGALDASVVCGGMPPHSQTPIFGCVNIHRSDQDHWPKVDREVGDSADHVLHYCTRNWFHEWETDGAFVCTLLNENLLRPPELPFGNYLVVQNLGYIHGIISWLMADIAPSRMQYILETMNHRLGTKMRQQNNLYFEHFGSV